MTTKEEIESLKQRVLELEKIKVIVVEKIVYIPQSYPVYIQQPYYRPYYGNQLYCGTSQFGNMQCSSLASNVC